MLKRGAIGVMPTDTIYGLVCSALDKNAVERIYRIRPRDTKKPPIILVGDASELLFFGVFPDAKAKRFLAKFWPGKLSVVLPLGRNKGQGTRDGFSYLHRGTKTLAFRVPKPVWLRALLKKIGPLIAPSANVEGRPPALTIKAARKYFGKKVDFYIDAGKLTSKPSTLVRLEKGKAIVLREGAVTIRNKNAAG